MPVYQTARFSVRPEAREECERAIAEFIAYIKDNEPGTQSYVSLQDSEDPASFLHFFIFDDEAARETHRSSEAVQRFTSILYPRTLAPVQFTEYRVVAST